MNWLSLAKPLGLALLGAALVWWGLSPRIDLQAQRADRAELSLADAERMVDLQAGVLAEQQRQIGQVAELDRQMRELTQDIHQSAAAQAAAIEELKRQDGVATRAQERLDELQNYLGDPEVATHALVYFQLRALWKACAAKVERFAQQLKTQQLERERRRQLIEFDQTRRRQITEFDRRIAQVRSDVATMAEPESPASVKIGCSSIPPRHHV